MKFAKHLMVLAIALCAIPGMVKAQGVNVVAVGGGSSALFLELGQGAQAGSGAGQTNTPCVWTSGKTANIVARDNRTTPVTGSPVDEQGMIWVTWSEGNGSGVSCSNPLAGSSTININVYSYMQLDSVVGNKCYFAVDSTGTAGCQQVFNVAANAPGANKLTGITDNTMPAVVQAALNGSHFTYAGTDIRPEDAQFATNRMFTPCGSIIYRNPFDLEYRLTFGLGYANSSTPNVGLQVNSAFDSSLFNVINFSFSGPDPFNPSFNAPQFAVSAVGAQPIVVGVAPASDTAGIAGANDISTYTLAMFYDGVLARSTDLIGPTSTKPVVTLVREPLSGTYNTFEYSIPNSSQFHKSQDDNFCNGSAVLSQTMNVASSTGGVSGAARKRVIGTGQMVTELQAASTDTLGYAFWSAANFNGDTNIKYLTVNGVDPLLDSYGQSGGVSYTPGVLPQSGGTGGTPPLTAVSFKNLNGGDYPVWSAIRLIGRPSDPGVSALLASLATINPTQHDYIPLSNLKVWHAHFPIYGVVGGQADGPTLGTAGDLCSGGAAEVGGDAGGANLPKQVNSDYCSDFGSTSGLVNQVN
jgi:hypothetical protein